MIQKKLDRSSKQNRKVLGQENGSDRKVSQGALLLPQTDKRRDLFRNFFSHCLSQMSRHRLGAPPQGSPNTPAIGAVMHMCGVRQWPHGELPTVELGDFQVPCPDSSSQLSTLLLSSISRDRNRTQAPSVSIRVECLQDRVFLAQGRVLAPTLGLVRSWSIMVGGGVPVHTSTV